MIRIENDNLEIVLSDSYFVIRNSDNKTEFRVDRTSISSKAVATPWRGSKAEWLRDSLDLLLLRNENNI